MLRIGQLKVDNAEDNKQYGFLLNFKKILPLRKLLYLKHYYPTETVWFPVEYQEDSSIT